MNVAASKEQDVAKLWIHTSVPNLHGPPCPGSRKWTRALGRLSFRFPQALNASTNFPLFGGKIAIGNFRRSGH
jgi:hypothetical protein